METSHVKTKSNRNSIPPNHPAVTSEETGASTISAARESGTSAVSGTGMLVGVVLQTLVRTMFV